MQIDEAARCADLTPDTIPPHAPAPYHTLSMEETDRAMQELQRIDPDQKQPPIQ